MKYTFLGHACFKIDTGKERLLFDPFLTGNGQAAMKADKVRCDYILLSHAHSDHFGDANEIALRTGAKVVAIPEVIALFSKSLSNFQPMNLGGTFHADFGDVKWCRLSTAAEQLAAHPVALLFPSKKALWFTIPEILPFSAT